MIRPGSALHRLTSDYLLIIFSMIRESLRSGSGNGIWRGHAALLIMPMFGDAKQWRVGLLLAIWDFSRTSNGSLRGARNGFRD